VNLLRSEKRTTFCGTFEYMVPEIVCEEKYDTGVDIWALGILLYEMLFSF
jgi:serine/threonine protein kinase